MLCNCTADDPRRSADNTLLYLQKVYDILETEDGSDLTMGCTSQYADAWEEKTAGMVMTINLALTDGLCEADVASVVTYIPSFASLGSQVKYPAFYANSYHYQTVWCAFPLIFLADQPITRLSLMLSNVNWHTIQGQVWWQANHLARPGEKKYPFIICIKVQLYCAHLWYFLYKIKCDFMSVITSSPSFWASSS